MKENKFVYTPLGECKPREDAVRWIEYDEEVGSSVENIECNCNAVHKIIMRRPLGSGKLTSEWGSNSLDAYSIITDDAWVINLRKELSAEDGE